MSEDRDLGGRLGLDMYLEETYTQINSMNFLCIEIIQAMEQVVTSIDFFLSDNQLKGKTYSSAKTFMQQNFRQLAQAMIFLCEELIRQNDKYPSDFAAKVAPTDVIEQEVLEQIREIDRLKLEAEGLLGNIPIIKEIPTIFDDIKQKLHEKLEHLYEFNETSSTNYDMAIQLAANITNGLAQLNDGKGFNSKTGTFSTKGMDLSWEANLQKVITILEYENKHPQYVNQTNEFLSPLAEKDRIEIKYLMYTAEEPYRTLALKYLDKFKIANKNFSGVFYKDENILTFDVSEDRNNERGQYYTFFHEVGHAIDYYYGIENGFEGFYSDSYTIDGKTLTKRMYEDAETHFRSELQTELKLPNYDHLNHEQKTKIINNITNNLNANNYSKLLTKEEIALLVTLKNTFLNKLWGPDHEAASDVYGGITNFTIKGEYGHQKNEYYWIKENGERTREPNREGFAEYYGRIMTPDGEKKDAGIESIEHYLPESKKHMDKMFKFME
ncbi:T7SS effector LXG polymorphic toxin [Neobacillus vireti]|uniref:T7SS effector LXG polymorphic toxin n=1 Tax=Neobacillus vireti TaxID=220686 RepID=UPI002FFDB27B